MAQKTAPENMEAVAEDLTERELNIISEIRQRIPLELENYAQIAQIENWKKCKPLEWHGFCQYFGETVFRDRSMLRVTPFDNGSCTITSCNAYNVRILSAIYTLYSNLCFTVPGLPCRAFDFQSFVGIPYSSWKEMRKRLTPSGVSLFEKMAQDQETTMSMGGEGGRINPTMTLAWLNHFHGWTQAREVIHRDGGQILDGGTWAGRFLGDSSKPCSIPEGKEIQGEAVLLPETT